MHAIDATAVAPGDRLEYWRDAVSDQFVPLQVEPQNRGKFDGRIGTAAVGSLQVRDLTATSHRFNRTQALLRRSDEDYFKIGLMESGSLLFSQDGRETTLGGGDLVLYDSTRPYRALMRDPFRPRVYMLPKRLLPLTDYELHQSTAIRVSGTQGVGALAVPFLRRLIEHADEYHGTVAEALAHTFAELLTAVVRDHAAATGEVLAGVNPHLCRVRSYIDQNVGDHDLTPERIASATSISVSYLHKLFSATGTTVTGYVRERRLQGCWRDLRSERMAHHTVTAISARWGIADPARMSRLFRARFGMTPTECRLGAG
ncbi:helix-turn-helix domain-containing protein [Amycolatopsis jejuensis]|uniref:AraC-like ligand-binding domain-containing protein n=1 Tax=Amycolatopsis jejuensis TaxID=330084 RepID=UPI0006896D92|nr:helix-turn-helix domain-containing protein [Amycolatopsis jejuensis]